MTTTDPAPDSLLPLPTAVFHILIALADRERHGYAIMQDVAQRTSGKVQLSAGTLYSSIRRMLEQGLIDELSKSPDPSSTDERRRYYRLTRFGRRVAVRRSGPPQQPRAAGARDRPRARDVIRCAPKPSTRPFSAAIRSPFATNTATRCGSCSPNSSSTRGGTAAALKELALWAGAAARRGHRSRPGSIVT